MVKSVATRHELVTILQSNELVVVDFSAKWCGPCKVMAPEFERLGKEYTKMIFLKVDVDDFDGADDFPISSVPTFLFYRNNKKVDSIVGADVKELEKKIANLCK